MTECKYKKLGLVFFFLFFFPIRCCELSALDATDSEAVEGESLFICAVRASLKLGPVCMASLSASLHTLSSSPLL